MKIEKSSNSV